MTSFTPYDCHDVLPVSLQSAVRWSRGDARKSLELAPDVRNTLGLQTPGNARRLWRGLAELGCLDLTVARVVEPHLDALSILEQARDFNPVVFVPDRSTWGVFAAEGACPPLRAERDADGGWRLTGRKPWCSLAGYLSHALVSAWTSERGRTLFAVRLTGDNVSVSGAPWVSRGLREVETVTLDFDAVPAHDVGPEDWYLSRPGFALGAVGVAAVWWGGASALVQQLHMHLAQRADSKADSKADSPAAVDQISLWHLGRCDAALVAAGAVLEQLAGRVDGDGHAGDPEWAEALRARAVVHDACETVLTSVTHALGPAPLTGDEDFARRVADLQVYLRQHKPEKDLATVGSRALDGLPTVWGGR
ncbi:acyl-CoA dehydrogenase family protein [Corynebacteriaceae bacterium 7-707]